MVSLSLTNLIELFDMIFEWYDEGDSLDIIYIDFNKAFGKVPHQKAYQKIGELQNSGECIKMDNKVARG